MEDLNNPKGPAECAAEALMFTRESRRDELTSRVVRALKMGAALCGLGQKDSDEELVENALIGLAQAVVTDVESNVQLDMTGRVEPVPVLPGAAKRVRKARSDKGTSKKKGVWAGPAGAGKRAPVGSAEVLTEPGAEEYARKAGTFRG